MVDLITDQQSSISLLRYFFFRASGENSQRLRVECESKIGSGAARQLRKQPTVSHNLIYKTVVGFRWLLLSLRVLLQKRQKIVQRVLLPCYYVGRSVSPKKQ